MIFKFLDEKDFYNTFLYEIADVQCGKHYDPNNLQHVEWLKRFIRNLYLLGGEALCLYTEDNKPVGFIYLLDDKGLENVACLGKKATIALFEVKSECRGKGYGKLLCQEAEKHLRKRGAECLYTDTYDDPDNRGALKFYVCNGFSPVGFHPCVNGKDDRAQIYLFKYL